MFLKGKTRLEAAAKLGIYFRVAPKISLESGIGDVRDILKICWFDRKNTTQRFNKKSVGFSSLEGYRKEWNENLGTYRNTPLHDYTSHGADAFRTLAVGHQFGVARHDFSGGGRPEDGNARGGGINGSSAKRRKSSGGWN